MKRIILFLLIQMFCFTAGLAQSPPWKENGDAIPARADLDVRWEATNKLPRKVWTYQLLPNDFSPEIISNVMTLCSFTEKDLVEHRLNGMDFQSSDGSRKLSISFPSGKIHYEIPEPHYSPTNLAVGVPLISQLPQMATNILRKLYIRFSDITGYFGTNNIEYLEPVLTMYYVGDTTITNIAYRSVLFRRIVDRMPITGEFYGFNVGEHGKISRLSITWPKLKRIKSYPTLTQKAVIDLLRKGDAIRGPERDNAAYINWPTIKSLTIKMAVPSYQMDGNRLYPFLYLDVFVDTGNGIAEIAMNCPIIDETKL
jgi:hypothetical protein